MSAALIVVLLNLLFLSFSSDQAFALGLDSVPVPVVPTGTSGSTPTTSNDVAKPVESPAPVAVQPTIAPVTQVATQTVKQATAPAGAGGSTGAISKLTAPVSSATGQSIGKVPAGASTTTAQVAKTAASAVKAVTTTAAPAIKTATTTVQGAVHTVAPTLDATSQSARTVLAPVVKAASATTQNVGKEVAPVLSTVARSTATPLRVAAPPTVASIVKSATADTQGAVANTKSIIETTTSLASPALPTASATAALLLQSATATTQGIVNTATPILATAQRTAVAATREAALRSTGPGLTPSIVAPAKRYPAAVSRDSQGPTPPLSGGPASRTSAPWVGLAGNTSPTPVAIAGGSLGAIAADPSAQRVAHPAGAVSTLPACAGSSLRRVAEALIASCATVSPALLPGTLGAEALPLLLGTELSPTSEASRNGAGGRSATAPSASSTPGPTHAPAPLPDGSSGAMASSAPGVGSLIFLILVGLLLMGGLAAMRLLRLASESWRPAPFVLIPERPG